MNRRQMLRTDAALVAETMLPSAKCAEVLSSLGNDVCAKLHFDAARRGIADGDVEINSWVTHYSQNTSTGNFLLSGRWD